MLGVTYLASVSASFTASCTHHTIADVVIVTITAFVSWYDWNFHILQVVWQRGVALNSEGKNAGSVKLLSFIVNCFTTASANEWWYSSLLIWLPVYAGPFLDFFVTYLKHIHT